MNANRWVFCIAWGVLTFSGALLVQKAWPETGSVFVWGAGAGLFLHAALRWSVGWMKKTEGKGDA